MTQPVAAVEETLGDLAQLASFVEGTDLEQTDELTKFFLAAATDAVRNYCGWHVFPVVDRVIVLDGNGASEIILPTLRIENIVGVVENGVTLTATDYEWSRAGMLRRSNYHRWTTRYRALTVSLRDGFNRADDLVATVYSLAARAASSPQGAVQDSAGPFSFSAAQLSSGVGGGLGLFAHERAVLDRYRRPDL